MVMNMNMKQKKGIFIIIISGVELPRQFSRRHSSTDSSSSSSKPFNYWKLESHASTAALCNSLSNSARVFSNLRFF